MSVRTRIAVAAAVAVLSGFGHGSAAGRNGGETTLVAFAVDTSGSIRADDLGRARGLVAGVMAALPAGAEAALVTFDDEARVVLPPTADGARLASALAALHAAGRHTAMNDALYDTARLLRDAAASRRALVLVTDGRDEDSAVELSDGLALAQQSAVPVFTVGVGRVDERTLRRIAKLTGGRYARLSVTSASALAGAIASAPVAPAAAGAEDAGRPNAAASAVPATRGRRAPSWALALTLAAAAGGAAYAWRRRARARLQAPAEAGPDGEPAAAALDAATIVERMNRTEEYLEKTVTLRERPVLTVTRGPAAGEVYELVGRPRVSIGRAKANEFVVDDLSVSSEHCRIRPEDGRFVVHDLRSTNGTFVNERRVTRHVLSDGDVLKIGETALQFRMDLKRA
jgi:hypothetical protein